MHWNIEMGEAWLTLQSDGLECGAAGFQNQVGILRDVRVPLGRNMASLERASRPEYCKAASSSRNQASHTT
jgi:hypothetical protein